MIMAFDASSVKRKNFWEKFVLLCRNFFIFCWFIVNESLCVIRGKVFLFHERSIFCVWQRKHDKNIVCVRDKLRKVDHVTNDIFWYLNERKYFKYFIRLQKCRKISRDLYQVEKIRRALNLMHTILLLLKYFVLHHMVKFNYDFSHYIFFLRKTNYRKLIQFFVWGTSFLKSFLEIVLTSNFPLQRLSMHQRLLFWWTFH